MRIDFILDIAVLLRAASRVGTIPYHLILVETIDQKSMRKPELFIGVVAPIGADLDRVVKDLEDALATVGYRCEPIHLIELIHVFERWKDVPESPLDLRIHKHMDAGNDLRRLTKRSDALAMLGVAAVRKYRFEKQGKHETPVPNTAYVFRSLKHRDEVEALRRIYGENFFLVAGYSPRLARIENLAAKIAKSYHRFQLGEYRAHAENLSQRDEEEVDDKYGQNVRKSFPLADLFLDTSSPSTAKRSVFTFVELLFGHPLHTPKRDEFAMFHAQAAALRSAALGRQVGAVIATQAGDIIAVGTNEVPKAGGGLYWADDIPDHRDFTLGYDTNDRIKFNIIGDILQRLAARGWLSEERRNVPVEDLVRAALQSPDPVLPKSSQVLNLTEFGRIVHAEMAALSNAAFRGISVAGCVLYATTFPCHNCAKHIVAAGIERVVYVEPYPKSLAMDLHVDAIEVDGNGCADKLRFTPFVGIAPRQYMHMFTAPERKNNKGDVLNWNAVGALPRFSTPNRVYVSNETNDITAFQILMVTKGLDAVK